MDRVDEIGALYSSLTTQINLSHNQVEDLLRMQVVYAVSCLDRIVHDVVQVGMVQTYEGSRTITPAYENFSIPLKLVEDLKHATIPPAASLFAQFIIKKNGYQSFQEPGKITSALNHIWAEPHKWQKIAGELGMIEQDVKDTLTNTVIRRNQIVHEADVDLFTQTLQPLAATDAQYMADFIRKLGKAIYDLVQ